MVAVRSVSRDVSQGGGSLFDETTHQTTYDQRVDHAPERPPAELVLPPIGHAGTRCRRLEAVLVPKAPEGPRDLLIDEPMGRLPVVR
jgi:hypothetical protein